jgi:chemotaxis protein CheD
MLGGMNHILLPKGSNTDMAARFGVNAMEVLINKIMALGGSRQRLVAKAFGGANVIASLQAPAVGELNADFVKEFLRTERIKLLAQRLGGSQAVKVTFSTDTARVIVSTVDGTALRRRVAEEESYVINGAQNRIVAGETTLF